MERVSFDIEFLFKASPTILYKFLTTPSCLVRWFCDAVDITGDLYTFEWSGFEETAYMIDDIEDERVRFHWEEYPDEFFEFRIDISPVTNETILTITDYCDDDEVDEQKELWESQISKLRRETGG
ncbi:START-like domain-containing protein [Membranihabitans maritimus]|uniref:START-like domain-containing protein n=1 Tax=Membranihabitans maritimus TaxID=2904244 RepID=UPI001F43D2C3|nr:START-like domain-containing protein [Membranihabitans maritimus]